MFKITSERIPDSQVVINIEVEPEQVTQALERAYRSVASRANVPGFRRGKAPRHMVERLYGKEVILHEGVDHLVSDAYRAALDQTSILPIDQPQLEFEPDIHDIQPGQGLRIKATVPVRPEVEVGDYNTLHLQPIAVDVTAEQINTLVSFYQQRLSEWVKVDRPAKMGDEIVADVTGVVGSATRLYSPAGESLVSTGEGEKLYDLTATSYHLNAESRAFAPGFAQQVEGMKASDTKGFELSLPADHSNPELANKMVTFTVKVSEVREEHQPELDDEFAKKAGFDSLDHMRESLSASIRRRMESEAREVYEERVLTDLMAISKVEIPPSMVDAEARRLLEIAREDVKNNYSMTVQERMHIEQSTDEDLLAEVRDRASRNVATALLLNEIADKEGVEVTPEEVDLTAKQVAEMRSMYGERRTTVSAREREVLERRLHRRKTVDRLIELAQQSKAAATETPSEVVEDGEAESESTETEDPSSIEGGAAPDADPKAEPETTPQPEETTK